MGDTLEASGVFATAMARSDWYASRPWLWRVGRDVLPAQRTKFSQQLTQPRLLAMLCLMRYEVWIFREAEVRLGEHGGITLRSRSDFGSRPRTTLYRFLRRLDPNDVTRVLEEIVRRTPGSWRSPATVALWTPPACSGAVSITSSAR